VTKAWSLSSGYFITGELPPYNARLGTFAQPKVRNPVLRGGPGAVEVLARYENIDYSGVPTAGDGWAATGGVNWYLDNVIRLQFNVIHWSATNRSGAIRPRTAGKPSAAASASPSRASAACARTAVFSIFSSRQDVAGRRRRVFPTVLPGRPSWAAGIRSPVLPRVLQGLGRCAVGGGLRARAVAKRHRRPQRGRLASSSIDRTPQASSRLLANTGVSRWPVGSRARCLGR